MKREPVTILGITLVLMTIWMHSEWKSNTDLTNSIQQKDNEKSVLDSTHHEIDSLYQAQSQINLRIMYLINDSEEKKLQDDSIYMSLTDKIN